MQGIAKDYWEALDKATKKMELKYKDIKKLKRGIRRRFHEYITIIVICLDKRKVLQLVPSWDAQLHMSDIFSFKEDKQPLLV